MADLGSVLAAFIEGNDGEPAPRSNATIDGDNPSVDICFRLVRDVVDQGRTDGRNQPISPSDFLFGSYDLEDGRIAWPDLCCRSQIKGFVTQNPIRIFRVSQGLSVAIYLPLLLRRIGPFDIGDVAIAQENAILLRGDDARGRIGADAVDAGQQAADLMGVEQSADIAVEFLQAAAPEVEILADVAEPKVEG